MNIKNIIISTLLLAFPLVGSVMAGGNGMENFDFCTEGPLPAYKQNEQFVHTKVNLECIDHETFFSEGMRSDKCTLGKKTVVPIPVSIIEFYCEGPIYRLPDVGKTDFLKKKALGVMPAAGSK